MSFCITGLINGENKRVQDQKFESGKCGRKPVMLKAIKAGQFFNRGVRRMRQTIKFGVNIKVLVSLNDLPKCKKPRPRLKIV